MIDMYNIKGNSKPKIFFMLTVSIKFWLHVGQHAAKKSVLLFFVNQMQMLVSTCGMAMLKIFSSTFRLYYMPLAPFYRSKGCNICAFYSNNFFCLQCSMLEFRNDSNFWAFVAVKHPTQQCGGRHSAGRSSLGSAWGAARGVWSSRKKLIK